MKAWSVPSLEEISVNMTECNNRGWSHRRKWHWGGSCHWQQPTCPPSTGPDPTEPPVIDDEITELS